MNRFVIFSIFVLFCSSGNSFSQITIGEDVSTDSVDLFSSNNDSSTQKSGGIAIISSLLLPGSGHHYLGHSQKALTYLTVDAISFFGAFFCNNYANNRFNDATSYASMYAITNGGDGADDRYWKLVGTFDDQNEYIAYMDRHRIDDFKYTDAHLAWQWNDPSNRETYKKIRENSQRFEVASAFFLGAAILNRVVAFIDIRSTLRNRSVHSSSLSFHPYLLEDGAGINYITHF